MAKPKAPPVAKDIPVGVLQTAVAFLEYDHAALDANMHARQEPESEDLARTAHMAGEDRETVRRYLADAIIDADPTLEARIRKVVKFSARLLSNGAIIGEGVKSHG